MINKDNLLEIFGKKYKNFENQIKFIKKNFN